MNVVQQRERDLNPLICLFIAPEADRSQIPTWGSNGTLSFLVVSAVIFKTGQAHLSSIHLSSGSESEKTGQRSQSKKIICF